MSLSEVLMGLLIASQALLNLTGGCLRLGDNFWVSNLFNYSHHYTTEALNANDYTNIINYRTFLLYEANLVFCNLCLMSLLGMWSSSSCSDQRHLPFFIHLIFLF